MRTGVRAAAAAAPLSCCLSLLDPVPEPAPANVGDEADRTVTRAGRNERVVDEHRPAAHVLSRHEAPVTTVLRVVPVVAHHEEELLRDDERAPVVVHGLLGRLTEPCLDDFELVLPLEERAHLGRVALELLRRGIADLLCDAIHVEHGVAPIDRVARHPHEAFHERWRQVVGLVVLRWRFENHHLAALRLGVPRQVDRGKRDVRPVAQLVHEEPVANQQRGNHAARRNTIGLDEEGAENQEDRDRAGDRLETFPELPRRQAAALLRPHGRDGALTAGFLVLAR